MLEIGRTSAEGVSVPLPTGDGSGEWAVPLPRKIFRFLSSKGKFWCILGATFEVELNGNWLGY